MANTNKNDLPVATEAQEQEALFRHCANEMWRYPMLANLVHVPNGGSRNKREAARLKREGVRAGYPDLLLEYASCGKYGLRIELKRRKGYTISQEQKDWIIRLNNYGYAAVFCFGWVDAWNVIKLYLDADVSAIEKVIAQSLHRAQRRSRIKKYFLHDGNF